MNKDELLRHIDSYIAIRESLGHKTHVTKILLKDFAEYINTYPSSEPIRAHQALDWACRSSAKLGAGGQSSRLSQIRGFLSFLRSIASDTEVPDHSLIAASRRPQPYLFTPTELNRLLEGALMNPRDCLQPHIWQTLIGLLASTGLRIGEALRLKMEDIKLDVNLPHLVIMETKFNKTRLVPLHTTTVEKLRHYITQRKRLGYDALSDYLFISETGKALRPNVVWLSFRRLMKRLGMGLPKSGRNPSLHCLRHTFAVNRLREWYRAGKDVNAEIANLSVYLGHIGPEETYWYLTATPELLGEASDRFRQYAKGGDNEKAKI